MRANLEQFLAVLKARPNTDRLKLRIKTDAQKLSAIPQDTTAYQEAKNKFIEDYKLNRVFAPFSVSETNDEYPRSDYSPEIGRFRPCNTTTVLEEDFKEFVTAVLTLDVDPNAVRHSSLNSASSSPSSASSSPSTTYAVPSTNAVSFALNVAAWIIAAICTIAALICFVQEDDFLLAIGFTLLGSGLISALFFLALSEIVHLLTQIRDKIK